MKKKKKKNDDEGNTSRTMVLKKTSKQNNNIIILLEPMVLKKVVIIMPLFQVMSWTADTKWNWSKCVKTICQNINHDGSVRMYWHLIEWSLDKH